MSANPATLWSTEEKDELRRLHALRPALSYTEIAKELGRKRNACIGQAHRLKLPDRSEFKRMARPAKPSTLGIKRRRGPVSTTKIQAARHTPPARTNQPPARLVLAAAPDGCRWPTGDHPFVFCAAPVERGQVYCGTHCRLAYRPRSAAPRRAA